MLHARAGTTRCTAAPCPTIVRCPCTTPRHTLPQNSGTASIVLPNKWFTGFAAKLQDGSFILEVNQRPDPDTKRVSATNWHRVPKDQIASLHIFWKGEEKASWAAHQGTAPGDWFFCHSAIIDMTLGVPYLKSRSIGLARTGVLSIARVAEANGALSFEVRSAP